MRRLHALLIAAGLLAAPTSAVAGPDHPRSDDAWTEIFEWSSAASRARLGVMVIGLTPELRTHFGAPADRGVLVGRVEPKSAAAEAGLAVGDILTEVKGEAVDRAADVLSALAAAGKGDKVALSVIRDGKPLALSATMKAGPRSAAHEPRWPRWIEGLFDRDPRT